MRVVVADTTPIRYLSEIGHIDILPRLLGTPQETEIYVR
jgi:predicted nucleic acid-binding protein